MKKIILICLFCLLCVLGACSSNSYSDKQDHLANKRFQYNEKHNRDYYIGEYNIICDNDQNVSYLVFNGFKKYGITIMLDSLGKPIKCSE